MKRAPKAGSTGLALGRVPSPKDDTMQISAHYESLNAYLHLTTASSSSKLVIKGAKFLADDLEQFLTDPDTDAVDRHYRVAPSDTGVSVETHQGKFALPWRHILPVVNGLRGVRRQSFWNQWRFKLRESLAHLVCVIMRRVCCDASVALRMSSV